MNDKYDPYETRTICPTIPRCVVIESPVTSGTDIVMEEPKEIKAVDSVSEETREKDTAEKSKKRKSRKEAESNGTLEDQM